MIDTFHPHQKLHHQQVSVAPDIRNTVPIIPRTYLDVQAFHAAWSQQESVHASRTSP